MGVAGRGGGCDGLVQSRKAHRLRYICNLVHRMMEEYFNPHQVSSEKWMEDCDSGEIGRWKTR